MLARIKQLSRRLGLGIRLGDNARPLDLRSDPIEHPLEALYQTHSEPFQVTLPLTRLRYMAYLGFRPGAPGKSPFRVAADALATGDSHRARESLAGYYARFQPAAIEGLFGIGRLENRVFAERDPLEAPHLASKRLPLPTRKLLNKLVHAENAHFRLKGGLVHGSGLFGPTAASKVAVEIDRLKRLCDGIARDGYRHDRTGVDSLSGYFMLAEDDWCLFVTAGHHRVAVLEAAGHATVPVHVHTFGLGGVIRRQDIEFLPMVRNGSLTTNEATRLFDRILAGRQPWQPAEPETGEATDADR